MKLTLTYEGHKGTEIDLSQGFTALAGVNNSGKSSINRAFTWACTSLPRGDSYMPWEGGAAEVKLEKGDNTVTRFRSSTTNMYVVNGIEYKALGTSVPDEVFEALKIEDLNLQKQIRQYYILEESAGTVAKLINDVAGISESDEALKEVKERLAETNKEKKSLEASIKVETELLQETEWYWGAQEAMTDISTVSGEIDVAEELEKRLRVLKSDIEYSHNLINEFPDYADAAYALDDIYDMELWIMDLSGIHKQLSDIYKDLYNTDLNRYEVLKEVDLTELAELDDEVGTLVKTYGDLTSMSYQFRTTDLTRFEVLEEADLNNIDELEYTITAAERVMSVLKDLMAAQTNLAAIEAQLIEYQDELGKIKDICPECGQFIGETDDIHIMCR